MPEAVQGYPKWRGQLSRGPRFLMIAIQEVQRALENSWLRAALLFCAGYAVITIGGLYTVRNRPPTWTSFMDFINLLRWASLAIASIAAGPTLLEDSQRGALELYHSRGVSRWDYLSGKIAAVWGLSFFALAAPGIIFWAGSYLIYDAPLPGWGWVGLTVLADAAIFSLVITGLGLGLSAISRSARAATLLLFGAVATLDILFGRILGAITKDERLLIFSPLAQMGQQAEWLYPNATAPHEFPFWWGLVGLGVLFILGWGATIWRQPRLKGAE